MLKIDRQRIGCLNTPCVGKYFDEQLMEEIICGAYRILDEVGIRLTDPYIEDRLKNAGFQVKNNRVCIRPEIAREYLEHTVKRNSTSPVQPPSTGEPVSFDGWINTYPYQYIDPETDRIIQFDTDSLTKMTRFIENFSQKQGFTPSVPGYPKDVPPELESLARYKIEIENCSRGWTADPATRLSAKYLFEMTAVMGQPIERLPVYMATPLTLGDESLRTVLNFSTRLKSVFVASMPSFGASTPLSVAGAFSLILAETLGGALIVHHLTGLPVDILPQVLPFDFHNMNIAFGSPEHLIFEWITGEFNARLFHKEFKVTGTNVHTWAKKPGVQAAAEKGTLIMAGALNGARYFAGLGALSLDEIFSPVQLVLDIEMLNHVSRTIKGIEVDKLPDDLIGMIQEGVNKGFTGSDLTLDNHQDYIWYPDLFERNNFQSWLAKGELDALSVARDIVFRSMRQPVEYILEPDKKRAIDEIYHQALKEAGQNV